MRPTTEPIRAEAEPAAVSAPGSPTPLAPFARWPVLALAGGFAVLLLATVTRYGYFGDELYFRWAGYHLDWSFPDQPPLLPLLAGLMDRLFPGSLVALRLPAVLCTALGVVVCALIARELGGSRRAQVVAAAAFVASPFMTLFGRYLLTSTVDVLLTGIVTLLVVRWVRTRDDRLLLATGLVVALALQAKVMVVIVTAALVVGVLVAGPRALLGRRQLWIGAGIAVATAVPMLVWQAANGWPQLRMGGVLELAAQDKTFGGGPFGFLLDLAFFCGFIGTLLLGYGLFRVFRSAELRFLGVAFTLLVALFLTLDWSGYYVAGLFPVLWAAGSVGLGAVGGRWFPWVVWPVSALAVAATVVNLPLQPLESVSDRNARFDVLATAGWPELVAGVAEVYHALPDDERARAAVVTGTYELAAAVDRYGAEHDLPRAYSPYLGAWYFGAPPEDTDVLVHIGPPAEDLRSAFRTAELVGRTDNGLGVENSFQDLTIWVLSGQTEPWSRLWPALRVP